MKQSINFSQFQDAFQAVRPDNFTHAGLKALYEWIEELDDSCGTDTELDVIALCCEFSEYDNLEEIRGIYWDTCEPFSCEDCEQKTDPNKDLCEHCGEGLYTEDWEETADKETLDYLQDHTTVITFDSGVIIQDF